MSELTSLETPNNLFIIEEPILTFHITPNNNNILSNSINSSTASHYSRKLGEASASIKNISSKYLFIRIKTTKKLYYSVNPLIFVLGPNSQKDLLFNYYIKPGEQISNVGHKFKFEAYVISSEEKEKDPKKLSIKYESLKGQIKVYNAKRLVRFVDKNNNEINNIKEENIFKEYSIDNTDNIDNKKNSNLNLNLFNGPNIRPLTFNSEKSLNNQDISSSSQSNENLLLFSDKTKTEKNTIFSNELGSMHKSKYSNAYKKKDEFENPKTEEESNALLNNLKVEYYKLQNELDNLIEKYYNLKNHVDLEEDEENKDIIFEEKNKNNDRKKKEIKLPQHICLGLFIIAVLVGFYLS